MKPINWIGLYLYIQKYIGNLHIVFDTPHLIGLTITTAANIITIAIIIPIVATVTVAVVRTAAAVRDDTWCWRWNDEKSSIHKYTLD